MHEIKIKGKKGERDQKGGEYGAVTCTSKLRHRCSLTKPQPLPQPLSNTVYSQEHLDVLVRISIPMLKHHDQSLLKKRKGLFYFTF